MNNVLRPPSYLRSSIVQGSNHENRLQRVPYKKVTKRILSSVITPAPAVHLSFGLTKVPHTYVSQYIGIYCT